MRSKGQFTVLGSGTSQGIPVIGCECSVCLSEDPHDKRLRTSLLVEKNNTTLLIDAGPDLRQQLLRAKIKDIDGVLITHEHQDHTAGLDELRAINFLQKHSVPIYCTAPVEERLREQYSYIFKNKDYPGIPQIHFKRISDNPFTIGGITVDPIKVWHGQLAVTGFRFDDFAYITDANSISVSELSKLEGVNTLILNALRREKHHSHFTLDEAIQLADRLKIPRLYLTHLSHQMGLHKVVSEELRGLKNELRAIAYDGLKIHMKS
jgi:phosphoribosyl 1,2-cyclic phosphate phosphodiesterase